MGETVDLFPSDPADDPDVVLTEAIGQLKNVLILGETIDGRMDVRCNSGLSNSDALYICKQFEHILFNQVLYGEDE